MLHATCTIVSHNFRKYLSILGTMPYRYSLQKYLATYPSPQSSRCIQPSHHPGTCGIRISGVSCIAFSNHLGIALAELFNCFFRSNFSESGKFGQSLSSPRGRRRTTSGIPPDHENSLSTFFFPQACLLFLQDDCLHSLDLVSCALLFPFFIGLPHPNLHPHRFLSGFLTLTLTHYFSL